jgi:WD40 repeat protein
VAWDKPFPVTWNHDGTQIVAASDKKIQLWDTLGSSKSIRSHCEFSFLEPQWNKIVSSSPKDKTIRVWDVSKGTTIKVAVPAHSMPFDQKGDESNVVSNVLTWDLGKDATCKDHNYDGSKIVSGGYDCHVIKIWDALTGELVNTFQPTDLSGGKRVGSIA